MATITFSNTAGSVTLPAPEPGGESSVTRIEAAGMTASGRRIVAGSGLTRRRMRLSIIALTPDQRAALENFLVSCARGTAAEFQYADSLGGITTVRFGEPGIEWTSPAATVHDAAFWLERDIAD